MANVRYLYPRLPNTVALSMALEGAKADINKLYSECATEHPATIFGTTGGTRVSTQKIEELRKTVTELAKKCAFPRKPSQDQARRFDASCAALLYDNMAITAHEAAQYGVWQFLCCVVMPHLVRWRFPGRSEGTTPNRYLGGVRNTFGRLWWRALIFAGDRTQSAEHTLQSLKEDELVQIMERPTLSGNRMLSRQVATTFLDLIAAKPAAVEDAGRMRLMREAQKRLMRLFPIVAFDLLDQQRIAAIVRAQFLESLAVLQRERASEVREDEAAYLV